MTGLLVVGLVFSYFQIYTLRNEIQTLQRRLENRYSALDRDIQDIYSNVDYQLKKQANLLNECNWEYVSADIPSGTVLIKCSVQPKEYTASTKATITVSGKETEMSFENGEYTALVTVPLYTDSLAESVSFIDGDTVRNQKLDWGISPRNEYLTTVYAQFKNGGGTANHTDKGMVWKYSGIVTIDAQRYGEKVDIQKIYLLTEKNGEIINRQELSVKEGMENHFKNSNTQPDPDGEYVDDINIVNLTYEKQVEIAIENGTEVLLKTEVIDGDRLHHITIIEGWRITSAGENQTFYGNRGAEAEIFSADGTPLFTYTDKTNLWW